MLINICCSGSSGSTLLSQQLDRHPDIACGAELNLFSKLALYDNYLHVKRFRYLIRRWGISSNPFSEVRPLFDNLQRYGLSEDDAWGWLVKSSNIQELAGCFENYVLGLTGKRIWAEKTPRNIRVISRFLQTFPDSRVIHIVRDPRDVVESLMNRGFDYQQSVEIWFAAVLSIQPYRRAENVFEMRYEDLVTDRMIEIEKICKFVGVRFDESYFQDDHYKSKGLEPPAPLRRWRADPRVDVSSRSIGRYMQNATDFAHLYSVRPTPEYAALIGAEPDVSFADLMRSYGYEVPDGASTETPGSEPFRTGQAISLKRRMYNALVDPNPRMPKILI